MPVESPAQDSDVLQRHKADSARLYAWGRVVAIGYFGFAALVGSADILYILRHYTRIPFGDYWIWLSRYYKTGLLPVIYAQVNEHRISVPGVFYFLDHRYLGATNTFLAIVSIAIQAGCIVLLIAPLWRRSEIAGAVRWVFGGFVIICMLWFIQAEDFFYPFSLCLTCANLGILAALNLFAQLNDGPAHSGQAIWVWISLLGSAVWATFSYGHGILVWPVMLAMGLALRYPARSLWIISAAFLCVLVIYFARYQSPVIHPVTVPGAMTTNPLDSVLHRPMKVAWYIILMLGLPFFGLGSQDVSISTHVGAYAVTTAGILLGGVFIWNLIRGKQRKTRSEIVYCSVLLLCAGTAFITALGRSNFPIWQALSGRYSPVPLLFWISLAALITTALSRWEVDGGLGRLVWCLALMLMSLSTISTQIPMGRYMANRERLQQAAAVSIAIGVPDQKIIGTEFTIPERVRDVDQAATRTLGHSMFARPETRLLGTPLLGHFHLAPAGACAGFFDQALLLPDLPGPGARLIGWAWDKSDRREAERVLVADEQMVIRGFGITHVERPDVAGANSDSAMRQAGWIAYSKLPGGTSALEVFADLGHDTVCQIGPPRKPAP